MMFGKKPLSRLLTLGCVLLASGCSFAPDYKAPEITVPVIYKESGDWQPAKPADDMPKGDWWKVFGDPRLNELENDLTNANQNLKIAIAQYDEARALAQLAQSNYFPTVTGNAGYQRERTSGTVANARPNKQFNDYIVGADLGYEVDVWGRVRNAVAAGLDLAQASAADLAVVDLTLHAELASDYFQLRGDDAAQLVLDQTAEIDQKTVELVDRRFKGGVSAEVDLDQAVLQLQNAKTQAADMRLHRAQLEHAIAVLTGRVPAAFNLPPYPLLGVIPPDITPGMPSILLQRRPDIAAAERRVAAANAEIGVARAAYFPTFSLTAMLGLESANPGKWLSAPSQFWSLGPSSVLTIIDGGRLSALSDQARSEYDQSVATYRQTVLTAYQDVEDNLSALHHLSEQAITQTQATDAAERALKQENYRYQGGAIIYTDVAISENAALKARLNLVNVGVRRMIATVQLFKALGGGWNYATAFTEPPGEAPASAFTSPITPSVVPLPAVLSSTTPVPTVSNEITLSSTVEDPVPVQSSLYQKKSHKTKTTLKPVAVSAPTLETPPPPTDVSGVNAKPLDTRQLEAPAPEAAVTQTVTKEVTTETVLRDTPAIPATRSYLGISLQPDYPNQPDLVETGSRPLRN